MPLAPLPEDDIEFVLTHRRWCTPVVAELTLEVVDHPLPFVAGQYVLLQDAARSVPVRSYSVACAPRTDCTLTFLVTAVAGGPTSTWLTGGAQPGDHVLVSGPYGTFVADPSHDGPSLYLAGGSGLAPARSLIEAAFGEGRGDGHEPRADATARVGARAGADPLEGAGPLVGAMRSAPRQTLLFSGRTTADVIDGDWFAELADRQAAFEYVRTLTRVAAGEAPPPLGRVPDVLPTLLPDLSEHAVYVSGSPGFVAACTRTAQRLGARPGSLHTEEFYAEPVPWVTSPPLPRTPVEETS